MVTFISATKWGVYITEEQNAQIAGNNPGGIDLDSLVDGDSYIYLAEIITFEHKLLCNREGDDFLGWKTIQTHSNGTVSGSVGGGIRGFFTITAKITEDKGEKLKTLYKKHVVSGDGNKFLVHQRSATVYEQFPNAAGTLKKYAEIIIRSMDFKEQNQSGKDNKMVILILEECHSRN